MAIRTHPSHGHSNTPRALKGGTGQKCANMAQASSIALAWWQVAMCKQGFVYAHEGGWLV